MGVLDRVWNFATRAFGRREAPSPTQRREAERVLTDELADGYRPRGRGMRMIFDGSADTPPLARVLGDVEAMLAHPRVKLTTSYYASGISGCEFEVEDASSIEHAKFAMDETTRFWRNHLRTAQEAYPYGRGAAELVYGHEDGLLRLKAMHPFHPADVRCLTRGGELSGVRLPGESIDLPGPSWMPSKAWWFAHNPRFDRWHGWPQVYSAWRPWRRLAGRDGAEEVVDGGVYRFAFTPFIGRFPLDDAMRNPDWGSPMGGDRPFVSNRDVMLQMLELLKAGGAVALSSRRDPESGQYLWDIAPVEGGLDVSHLLVYTQDLEKAISLGIGVPPELLEASETGSGYSGRAIPLEAFLWGQQHNADAMCDAVYRLIVLPLLLWNFGPGSWARIRPKKIIEQRLKQQQGEANEQPPEQPGQPPGAPPQPPQKSPQQPPPNRPPQQQQGQRFATENAKGDDQPPDDDPPPDGVLLAQLEGRQVLHPGPGEWVVGDDPGFDPDEDEEGGDEFSLVRFATNRAPPGGITIAGKDYRGGQFIPSDVLAQATPEQRQQIDEAAGAAGAKRKEKDAARRQKDLERLGEKPKVKLGGYTPHEQRNTERGLAAVLEGTGLPPEDAPVLVGALGGSEATVRFSEYESAFQSSEWGSTGEGPAVYRRLVLKVHVDHPAVTDQVRTLTLSADGSLSCHNDLLFLEKHHRGGGLGLKVFSDQVRALADVGADYIDTRAGKGSGMNGYYTWPRLGYDAPLPSAWSPRTLERRAEKVLTKAGVPPEEAKARAKTLAERKPETVQDLFESPDGRAVWKAFGTMEDMKFDLRPGSRSLKVLNEYLASKGKPPIEPDTAKAQAAREARAKSAKAAIEGMEKPPPRPAGPPPLSDRQAVGARGAYQQTQERFAAAGLDPAVFQQQAEASVQSTWEKLSQSDFQGSRDLANDAGRLRQRAYDAVYYRAVIDRHRQRMNRLLMDPELQPLANSLSDDAMAAGLDPAAVMHEAREHGAASTSANDEEGIRAAFGNVMATMLRRRSKIEEIQQAERQESADGPA